MNKLENKYINNGLTELISLYKVWRSREYAGTSRIIPVYEQELQEYFGDVYARAVSNGTDAIEVAVRALGLEPGDEIMMPAYAPVMSVIPLLHYGLKPVFVDCERDTFNLSLTDIKRKKTSKTRALLVVPMWGYPIEMDALQRYCKKAGYYLIEDASHCHGSRIETKLVGTFADISTFSTQERKMIATGEGGFLLTASADLAKNISSVRDFGKVQENDAKYPDNVGEYGYHDGSNFRISAASAALGIAQVKKLNSKILRRTNNAQRILRAVSGDDRFNELRNISQTTNNYYSLVFLLRGLDAQNLGRALAEQDIISDTYRFKIRPLYRMPQFEHLACLCPNTEDMLRNIITLPTHEGMSSRDIRRITHALSKFVSDTVRIN